MNNINEMYETIVTRVNTIEKQLESLRGRRSAVDEELIRLDKELIFLNGQLSVVRAIKDAEEKSAVTEAGKEHPGHENSVDAEE